MRTLLTIDHLVRDARSAARRLRKSPAFTIVAALSLALGIGVNTAAFAVAYAVMFRPLPVEDPSRLALVSQRGANTQFSMPYPAYAYLRDHASATDGIVAFRQVPINVRRGAATDRLTAMLVSGNYFDVLGVRMAIGGAIGPADDRTIGSGGDRGLVAVLSHQYWMQQFDGDPAVFGRPLRINDRPFTIVGVAPAAFRGTRVGTLPDVFVPMMFSSELFNGPAWLTNPRNNWLRIIARLKPGVSLAQGDADLSRVFLQFNRETIVPLLTSDDQVQRALARRIALRPGQAGLLEMGDEVPSSLGLLLGLVGVVLLIACVNVASLMVARAEQRHRETAIALALGATRARLWSQSVIESTMVGGAGLALGLVLAVWLRALVARLVPAGQDVDVSMDAAVIGLSLLVSLLIAFALGAVAAWQSRRVGVIRALKGDDVSARLWLRKGLIVGQLALSVVVLVAAALFAQTLTELRDVDPGFARERLLIAAVALDRATPDERQVFFDRLLETVRALPGVTAAATADAEPLGVSTGWSLRVASEPGGASHQVESSLARVSPGYFATMGTPLVRGRDLEARDVGRSPTPVIVNESFVRRYAGQQEPIGLAFTGNGTMSFDVVGVVKDSAAVGLREMDEPMLYLAGGGGTLHVRAAIPPATLTTAVIAAVHGLDPNVAVFNVRTIEEQLERVIGRERTFAGLSSTFGLVALVLAAVGLYGVIAHAVARRTRELGIRVALGAEPRRIVTLVLSEAGWLVTIGLLVGIPAAYALSRALGTLLYGVQPGDPRSVGVAIALLTLVAAGAAWLPARRAARVDPLTALRAE